MPTMIFIALLVVVTPVLTFSGADISVSSFFYSSNGEWIYAAAEPWAFLYRFGPWGAYLLAGAALLIVLLGYFRPNLAPLRRSACYLVLVLLIGPGLLVNTVFKDHWGRPRPRQISTFGGTEEYHPVWRKGYPGEGLKAKSFPSGHASGGFYLATPYFVLRRRRPHLARGVLCSGILAGALIGVARIAQGGHFLTDVLWAAGFVFITAEVLYRLMFPETAEPAVAETEVQNA